MQSSSRVSAATLAKLAEEIFAAGTVTETAGQVVAVAAAEIEVDHVGIVLLSRAGIETVAATSIVPDRLAQLPLRGPYHDPSWKHQALVVDLEHDQRWPEWSAAARRLGQRHLLAIELTAEGRRTGVLAFLTEKPREFSDDDVAFAHIFGRHAALALEAAHYRKHMQIALDGRKLIGQAQGILMERYQLDDQQAFALLQRLSQTSNRKLREIAAELVTTRGHSMAGLTTAK